MHRTQITADVVNRIDGLLDDGIEHAAIADRLAISEYIIGVIAGDQLRWGREQPPDRFANRTANASRGVDVATIRMIKRMLDVGALNQSQIAREAGVSAHVVRKVLVGDRAIVTTERPFVFSELGERFLETPIRCQECGALIYITPCRACRARLN